MYGQFCFSVVVHVALSLTRNFPPCLHGITIKVMTKFRYVRAGNFFSNFSKFRSYRNACHEITGQWFILISRDFVQYITSWNFTPHFPMSCTLACRTMAIHYVQSIFFSWPIWNKETSYYLALYVVAFAFWNGQLNKIIHILPVKK